ncbi:hypothetical protein Lser_V15G04020 [Lactuca serriola]
MAESSSVQDTSAHSNLLTIKPQQNLIIDLTPFINEPYMLYIVECLKYSPLVDAFTKVEVVPMTCLSHIYSTAYYDKVAERIHFDIDNEKTSISKNRFYALIGLAHEPTLVNPDSITTGQLFSMFYQMGYTENLTTVTKFEKSCLPAKWNNLFTLLFKGLSERSTGFDGASKSFMTILYGLYNGVTLDYGAVIWKQLSIITKWAVDHLHVPIMVDSLLSSIATFHTTKIIVVDPSKYLFIRSIPAAMYAYVTKASKVIQEYKKLPSSGPKELTLAMIRSIEKADKPAKRERNQKHKRRYFRGGGTSKKGGEGLTSSSQPPPKSQPPLTSQRELQKPEHPLGSSPKGKGKGPIVDENDEEEETIADTLKRKAREREIDLNAKIVKEAEERERRLKEAQDVLESKKTLFPFWTLEKLIKEAIDSPSTHWLELKSHIQTRRLIVSSSITT